jgi:hypothetical protein
MQTMPPPGPVQGPTQPPLPPPAPPAPVAAKTRSPLGRLVLSLALFGVGIVALIDVAGARVPASVYFAVALTVVAAGLLAGAWYGRARWLIAVGAVLSVLLAITAAVEGANWTADHQTVTWQPAGFEQVQPSYSLDAGNAVLDLSGVNFTGHTTLVDVHVSAGNLTVVLAPTVDARINSTVAIGNATVLGQHWNGIGQSQHTVTDNGVDGPGGGTLTLTATVNVGNLEVRR